MTMFLTSHLELHVKTVKYFKSIEYIQEQVERLTYLRRKLLASAAPLSGSSHRPHQLSAPSLEASATSPNSADLPATPSAACEHERTTHHTHRVDTHCMSTTSKRGACSLTAHHHRLLYPTPLVTQTHTPTPCQHLKRASCGRAANHHYPSCPNTLRHPTPSPPPPSHSLAPSPSFPRAVIMHTHTCACMYACHRPPRHRRL